MIEGPEGPAMASSTVVRSWARSGISPGVVMIPTRQMRALVEVGSRFTVVSRCMRLAKNHERLAREGNKRKKSCSPISGLSPSSPAVAEDVWVWASSAAGKDEGISVILGN